MREVVSTWHAQLSENCAVALAGADATQFAAAVSVVRPSAQRRHLVNVTIGSGVYWAM